MHRDDSLLTTILSFQTMNSDSSSAWTTIGKGGRAVPFPSEAASAFASSRRSAHPQAPRHGRNEFPSDAASAFGRKERREDRSDRAEFDSSAASAFGRKERRGGGRGGAPFDHAAASAFGGHRSDFPSAFGKKRPVDIDAEVSGGAGYGNSAMHTRRVAEPVTPPSYDELFPTLGSTTAKSSSSKGVSMASWANVEALNEKIAKAKADRLGTRMAAPSTYTRKAADVSAAVVSPAPKPVTTDGKRSFAEIMRERAAAEAIEAERKAAEEAEMAARNRAVMLEREQISRLHTSRYYLGPSCDDYEKDYEPVITEEHKPDDLDYEGYGVVRSEVVAEIPEISDESSESDYDDADE